MFRSYRETFRTDLKSRPSQSLQAFSCDLCDESSWLSETDVEIHRKEAHFALIRSQMLDHKECFCTICMTLQESPSALITHIKSRHLLSSPSARRVEREIFICDHCDRIFFNKDLLQAHIMYLHLWPTRERNLKTFSCPKCKKICKLRSIWFHLQLHEIPSLSTCEICLAHCPNMRELKCHLKSHQMYYKCEICNYHTNKDFHYEAHLDKHHRSPLKPNVKIGKLMREAFGRHTSSLVGSMMKYNIHHSLKGLELPTFINVCSLCREICTDKAEAKQHILRDHLQVAEARKPFRCLCGEEFFNRVLLRHHIFKGQGDHHRELKEMSGKKRGRPLPSSGHQNEEPDSQDTEKTKQIETTDAIGNTHEYSIVSSTDELVTTNILNVTERNSLLKKKLLTKAEMVSEETLARAGTLGKGEMLIKTEVSIESSNKEFDETEYLEIETDLGDDEVNMEKSQDELTYIYAEVDEDQLVTIDSDTNEEVISF